MNIESDYADIFSTKFTARFQSEYQATGRLADIIDPNNKFMNCHDSKISIPTASRIDLVPLTSYQAQLASQETHISNSDLTFTKAYAKHSIGELEMVNFHPNAVNMLVSEQVKGVMRYEDDIIIKGLVASNGTQIAAPDNLTTEIFTQARIELGAKSVDGKFYFLMHWRDYASLLKDTQFTSNSFNSGNVLNRPSTFSVEYLDFTIIVIGDILHKDTNENMGLPITAGGVRSCFAFSNNSLVYGTQVEFTPRVVHYEDDFVYRIANAVSVGCIPFKPEGVVQINCTET